MDRSVLTPSTLCVSRRLTYNAVIKLASEVVGRVASFALMIVAARRLGEAGFGIYNYGLALGFVLAQLADMGLQTVISREVAVGDRSAQPMVRLALHLKAVFSLAVIGLVGIIALSQPRAVRPALLLLGLLQLSQTYLEFAAYIYRGQQRLWHEAWLLGGARVAIAVIGAVILLQGGGVWQLAAGSLLTVSAFTVLGLRRLRRSGWLRELYVDPKTDPSAYWALLRQAAPLGVAVFLSIAYTRSAVLLLQLRIGETAVAHYSAASRLVEPMQVLPASLMAAVFPAISLVIAQDPRSATSLGVRVSGLLGGCGLVLAGCFWLAAGWLVPWLYGEAYQPAIPVLQILGLTVIPAFVNYSLTHYLIARRQQVYLGVFTAIMLGLHLAVSWVLVDHLGLIGPAVSTLISEGFLLLACLSLLGRRVRPDVVDI